jgi:hypothetical protein
MSRFSNHGAAITRSYAVVSSRGTAGTYQQQVLVFTVAGCKAPPRIFQGFLTAFGKARLVRRGRVHRWLARVSDEPRRSLDGIPAAARPPAREDGAGGNPRGDVAAAVDHERGAARDPDADRGCEHDRSSPRGALREPGSRAADPHAVRAIAESRPRPDAATSSVSRLRAGMPLAPSVVCIATSAIPGDSCANITRNTSLPLAVGGKLLY